MQFCINCDNMLYCKLFDDSNLMYYCKQCGFEHTNLKPENMCISKIDLRKKEINYKQFINKYTKLDPTLPRIEVKCPNANCISNTSDVKADTITIKYDKENIKYIYMCSHCDEIWNSNIS